MVGHWLWRLGRLTARRAETRWQRTIAIAMATCLLAIGLALTVGAVAYNHWREQTTGAIHPAVATSPDQAKLLWLSVSHPDINDHAVGAFAIQPLVENAPLPPGVSAWPDPGQAVISPALVDELPEQWEAAYGKVVGIISLDGLETPHERRVYFRPAKDITDLDPIAASGFGVSREERFTFTGVGSGYAAELLRVLALTVGIVIGGALATLSAAVQIGADRRCKRLQALVAQGANRFQLATITLVETVIPILIGGLLAAAAFVTACLVDIRFAWLDAVWPAELTRRLWPWLIAAVAAAAAIVLTVVLANCLTSLANQRFKKTRRVRMSSLAAAITCLLTVTATIWVTSYLGTGAVGGETSAALRMLSYYAGTFVTMLTVGALATVAVKTVSRWIGIAGRRWGIASALVGGRSIEHGRGRGLRVCLSLGVAVLLAGQVQLFATTLSLEYYRMLAVHQRLGTQYLEVFGSVNDQGFIKFVSMLPGDVSLIAVTDSWDEHSPAVVTVTPPTADWLRITDATVLDRTQLMGLANPVGALFENGFFAERAEINVCRQLSPLACQSDEMTRLFLVSQKSADLSLWDFKALAAGLIPGGLGFDTPGGDWLGQGVVQKTHADWAAFFGLISLGVVTLAAALLQSSESRAISAVTAPLCAYYGRRRWLIGLCLWQVVLPITVTGGVAAACYYLLPQGLALDLGVYNQPYYQPSASFALSIVAVMTVAGVIAAAGTFWSIRRQTAVWRPGTGDLR
ncbi:MAG: hypothetical protein LBG70_00965 [Bifidobacteriaceae bacterium]|jgi:hypothetical protein|nr:hypothetical protein [Bifidobacteriaceae bacterium]